NWTDISFMVSRSDAANTVYLLDSIKKAVGFRSVQCDESAAKISIVGRPMMSAPGVCATMFGALAVAGINIIMISTSEIRISAVVDDADLTRAADAVHTAFNLNGEDMAVVYAGSGR